MTPAVRDADDVVEALHQAIREGQRVLPAGGRTKPALSTPPAEDVVTIDTRALRGIVEYDPRELTLTARAGTPVSEVRDALAEHGQHLPFDPPLVAAGATLGGVLATGAAGAGGLRHGGVRDFVIGVRFVDGTGTLVGGGGRVVKNAAGFDLPKLMVGSIGRLGVIVQLSFKVFPRPLTRTTAVIEYERLEDALAAVARIGRGPLGVEAIDIEPPGRVLVRLNGPRDTAAARIAEVAGATPAQLLENAPEQQLWDDAAELRWIAAGHHVVRVPLTLGAVPAFQAAIRALAPQATIRYTLGANAAWLAWPDDVPLDLLDEALSNLGLAAVRLTGPPGRPLLGAVPAHAFAQRIRAALDPHNRFPEE